MIHTVKASSVMIALGCVLAGTAVAGCDASQGRTAVFGQAGKSGFTGTKKIKVDGHAVNVSCSGHPVEDRPTIVLLPGLGDGLTKMAALQKTLSAKDRVCSYDRLGEGESDKPDGQQTYASSGKILTGVLDKLVGYHPVVLAGHSLGGAIAATYTQAHRDRVEGLVLIDATPPTTVADTVKAIPAKAPAPAGQLRAQLIQVSKGQNPELLKAVDTTVKSAGSLPVAVLRHGGPYLSAVPKYGPTLEKNWRTGQRKWLALSSGSHLTVAPKSSHYIYADQPALTVRIIRKTTTRAANGD